jgi:PAS domain S-box-containing protein
MDQQLTDSASQLKRLQRCMNELVSVLALPSVWSGSEPSRILEIFLDALLKILDLDFLYVRARIDSAGTPIEVLRAASHYGADRSEDEIRQALSQWLISDRQRWTEQVSIRVADQELRAFPMQMGLEGELGLVVAVSERIGFPEQTEKLILGVAANQTALALQQALLLSEQRRVANDLDHRVAQRTVELAAANELLREEIAERKEIEKRLLASEVLLKKSETRLWRVIDTIPTLVWSMLPDGSNEFLSKRWHEYTGLSPEESHGWGWQAAFLPEDLPPLLERWQELLISGEPGEIEARLRRYDGVYRWFLIRVSPFRDETGTIARWYGTTTDIDDRKRAEEELKRSEARYRVVVETASDAVVSINESGTIILANPATSRIFGYNSEKLIGKPLTVLMPGAMRNLHKAGFKRYMETGARHLNWLGTELIALRANGEEFPVEVSFGEMTVDQRKVFTGFIRDISEKKRSEEALLASERNLSLIINTMPVLAWSALADGTVEFFNQRWLDYTGFSPEQAQGWGWTDAFHPDDLGQISEHWRSMMLSGGSGEIEARLRRFDGDYRWFLLRAEPMRDQSGGILKWYGTNTDIDDRKRAEEALRIRELNLRQITETIPEMLWSASPDGAIEYCNGRLLDYTGLSLEEVMNHGWMSLLHPDDVGLTAEVWMSCVKTGAPYRVEVRSIHAADNAYRWCVTSALPLHDQEGRIVRWHGTVVDMHDWKQAQEQLRNTQEELARMMRVMTIGQLTASIAHEVSQPLSGIIMNASTCLRMLNSNPPNIDGARETAQRTIRDGNRATDVITRLRTLFSKKQINIEPVDMNEAAREVLALVSAELQRRDSLLLHQFSNDLPPVMGDRVQLQQVILNLLRNGSDAMETVIDRPRQLLIRTETDNNCVRVSVQDSGVGFDPGITDRLFESFFTTKQEGMGIGLSVSRSIVEAHHGKLWATRNDGPGATFAFSIPCNDGPTRNDAN